MGRLSFPPAMSIMTQPPATVAQWAESGIPVCTAPGYQSLTALTFDGDGGAIIAWNDERSGNWDIYTQRVDASGTVLWDTNGVPICTATGLQWWPQLIPDGTGGAIITWQDARLFYHIYAQHVEPEGQTGG